MSSSIPIKNQFKYVMIPANQSLPIQEKISDKSGGLSDDYLAKEAKQYFYNQSDGAKRAAALDNATPEERKALATKIREDYAKGNSQINQLSDDALIDLIKTTHSSASCEIIALTIPTKSNNYNAVSLYSADDARIRQLPHNARATKLMEACGHALPVVDDGTPKGLCGDVFVGRCIDDEIGDVWERVDITVEDVEDPMNADWCINARTKGGGGGSGGSSTPSSLSGMMQNALGSGGGGGGGSAAAAPQMITEEMNGLDIDNKDGGYKWSQTDEEVDIKFAVSSDIKAKNVKVKFGRNKIEVKVLDKILVSGETGGIVTLDECTYTIQDDKNGGGRELCVTLGKKDEYPWSFAVKE